MFRKLLINNNLRGKNVNQESLKKNWDDINKIAINISWSENN